MGWTWDFYTWAWIAWVAMFFAIEIPASVRKQPGGTLSEHIWAFMGIGVKGWPGWRIKFHRILMLALGAWLIAHLFFQFA